MRTILAENLWFCCNIVWRTFFCQIEGQHVDILFHRAYISIISSRVKCIWRVTKRSTIDVMYSKNLTCEYILKNSQYVISNSHKSLSVSFFALMLFVKYGLFSFYISEIMSPKYNCDFYSRPAYNHGKSTPISKSEFLSVE